MTAEQNTSIKDRGVVFVAVGDLHRKFARQSARRIRSLYDDLPVICYTDKVEVNWGKSMQVRPIDDPVGSLRDKVETITEYAMNPKFRRTIYLDCDTWVCDEAVLEELFNLLTQFPLAAGIDESRRLDNVRPELNVDIDAPRAFPMPNTGVLPFKPLVTTDLLCEWRDRYRTHEQRYEVGINDQAAFRETLANADCRWGTLSAEYNLRVTNVPQSYYGPARIVHSMASNLPEIAERLDQEGWHAVHPIPEQVPRDDHVELLNHPDRDR